MSKWLSRKTLLLSLLMAIFLMSSAAPHAQAQEWTIGGKTFNALEIEEESVSGGIDAFKYLVPSLNFGIMCEELELSSGKLMLKGLAVLTFQPVGCILFQIKPFEEAPWCVPKNLKFEVLAKVVLSEEKTYVLFSSLPGKIVFMQYTFEWPECPFGQTVTHPVNGSFAVELQPESETQELSLGNHAIDLALGDFAKLGSRPVAFEGTLLLNLSGPFKEEMWGGS